VARVRREKEVEEDKILDELRFIRDRINTASSILTDRKKTAFFFVVIPEEMILLDTAKAAELFAAFNVPIGGYVVNRVIPEDLLGENVPPYLKNRIEMQRKYLGKIDQTFGDQILARVPEMERDVTGLEMIERVAARMYGEG
jgi:arsenite-transporting ATPase